ncbi:sorbosone dehydrogenase family protein [Neobacillus novalis]|uniref:Sorbosone dehydrogenase family protein n=1 Tax=Neobacillus novalis TaxID=220687 RepID=A0AA95MN21_9BACI|nr:sorbosone dehydrogenase family protein [Neobacillus novalis]WHY86252.1 sorbosone dehydrogenase family protein [Neobacillus novalis]
MYRGGSVLLVLMLLLSGCSFFGKKEDGGQADEAAVIGPEVEVVAVNLSVPWSIDMLGQTFYLSERTGSIVKIEDGKMERQRVSLEKPLAEAAEAGLLGFVLDPEFAVTQKAFVYYTYADDGGGQFNRVVDVVLGLDDGIWTEERILLDRIPSAAYHHGGRMKIGPDGKLFITTGDATTPSVAQNLGSLNGKILRMNLDGTIPADNPVPNSYVYSYGHRNPQGLAWIGKTIYASEHGQSAHDEINRIVAGANYGWPVIQGLEKKAGMETPLFQSGASETWAPSGMAAADGKLYVAELRGNVVREFDVEKMQTRPVVTGLGRIRDVFIDGDYLYFVSNNTDGRGNPDERDDKMYRVRVGDLK